MITIIDYGVGNINAFYNIYKNLGIVVKIAKSSKELVGASKLILPGVGHFDYAMTKFKDSGMINNVTEMVLNSNIPILGICVGMQMLAQSSEEGVLPGLGWVDGEVKKINSSLLQQTTRLPHMGWNDINVTKQTPLFGGLESSSLFYFLHSYYFKCHNNHDIISTSFYGENFTSSVNYLNIYGVQFHPEKSHRNGIKLLENFAKL